MEIKSVWITTRLTQEINGWDGIARSQPRQLVALPKQKRIRTYDKSIGSMLGKIREGLVDFTLGACVPDVNLYCEPARGILNVAHLG